MMMKVFCLKRTARVSTSVSSITIMDQTKLNAQLEGWSQAYDDLLKQTSIMMTVDELRGAILLKMH